MRPAVSNGSGRPILRSAAFLISVVIATAAFSGCGDTSDSGSTSASSQPAAPEAAVGKRYLARAEAICRQSVGEIHELTKGVSAAAKRGGSIGETIAAGLVRPGIAILDRKAADLRALEPAPESESLRLYLGLYDPILELSHQLEAAREANDATRSKELELIIAELGHEQRDVARAVGFKACATTFTEALGGV